MPIPKLDAAAITESLSQLTGWSVTDGKLHREYSFPDFATAISFITSAAPTIDKLNHHPEWANVYNRVVVDLTTHDSGGITAKDVELAQLLETLSQNLSKATSAT